MTNSDANNFFFFFFSIKLQDFLIHDITLQSGRHRDKDWQNYSFCDLGIIYIVGGGGDRKGLQEKTKTKCQNADKNL